MRKQEEQRKKGRDVEIYFSIKATGMEWRRIETILDERIMQIAEKYPYAEIHIEVSF